MVIDEAQATAPEPTRPERAETLGAALRLFLGHWSARLLVAQWLVFVAVRPFLGAPRGWDLVIVAAVATWWPLMEWMAHIGILHARPKRLLGLTIDPVAARYHRRHHAEPWNLRWVFLPTAMILALMPVHAVLWVAITRDAGLAVTGMVAFGGVAILYEWTHFLTHVSYAPKRSWYRTLQRRHRLHHFKNEHYWLGFTVPWVDDMMRTAPDSKQTEVSPTVRTLGISSSEA